MKKVFVTVMAMVVAMGTFVGCGNASTETAENDISSDVVVTENTTEEETETTVEEESEAPTTESAAEIEETAENANEIDSFNGMTLEEIVETNSLTDGSDNSAEDYYLTMGNVIYSIEEACYYFATPDGNQYFIQGTGAGNLEHTDDNSVCGVLLRDNPNAECSLVLYPEN